MAPKQLTAVGVIVGILGIGIAAFAYPPATGILTPSKSCLSCHVNNGPWQDESQTIVDIIDKATGKSLKQADGSFLIEAVRFETKTVLTVIGRSAGDMSPTPYRNGWMYIDPARIPGASLSKFAAGWSVDVPLACRLVGDKVDAYPGAAVTSLPMTVRPMEDAQNVDLDLHVMLTSGESVKGDASKGLLSNYLVRTVKLRVLESK
jgi:hypothetical protein